jgi:nitrite reductase (NAD(P)H)
MASSTEPIPILTQGIEPTSGDTHSPVSSSPNDGVWGTKTEKSGWDNAEAVKIPEKLAQAGNGDTPSSERKKVVVVGLGMVGVAFM